MTRIASIFVATSAVVLAALALAACGGKSCETLCTEGQTGMCTTIHGNCGSFCSALDSVKGPAMCSTAYDEYQTCLSAGSNACSSPCGSEETALTGCITRYCYLHSTDPDCVTLATSF